MRPCLNTGAGVRPLLGLYPEGGAIKVPPITAYLFRPYLDLSPGGDEVPLHARGIELAHRVWTCPDMPQIWFQRLISTHLRVSLKAEALLDGVAVRDPRELPLDQRSERWSLLCDALDNWDSQPVDAQLRLTRLLMSLCFYETVLVLVPPPQPETMAASESAARLAIARASSRLGLHMDGLLSGAYQPDDLMLIARHAPQGKARFNAAVHLMIQAVKHRNDPQGAKQWAAEALAAARALHSDPFHYPLVLSRYYRAYGFIPQFQGERQLLVAVMDQAEEYAHAVPRRTPDEALLADDNLYSLLESRTKEALWLGDLAGAEERARRLVELAPLDAKAWIELGEVLLHRERVAEAATAYRTAMRYGPPGTAVAAFMAGQCHEELGEQELACAAYLAALRADPFGVAAARRLRTLANRMGDQALTRWCEYRLERLKGREV